MHGAVTTALVREARSNTASTVIGCKAGSFRSSPYAWRNTTSPPWTTAITAPGTSPRATAPPAASVMARTVDPGSEGRGGDDGGGEAGGEAEATVGTTAVGTGSGGTTTTPRAHPTAVSTARASTRIPVESLGVGEGQGGLGEGGPGPGEGGLGPGEGGLGGALGPPHLNARSPRDSSISSALGTTMMSLRRFFCWPSLVALFATGSVSAKPAALQCALGRMLPLPPTRNTTTDRARITERPQLSWKGPPLRGALSVWPATW